MLKNELIIKFYAAILNDKRISFRHIAVYLALVQHINDLGFANEVQITRKKIMQYSKVKSLATYHRCISELQQFGYISYQPSYHPFMGSLVSFNELP